MRNVRVENSILPAGGCATDSAEDRSQESEDRRQKSEDRSQESEALAFGFLLSLVTLEPAICCRRTAEKVKSHGRRAVSSFYSDF